jgi:hypothetical protein
MDIVENQLRDNTPPETRQTLERLIADGHPLDNARRLIGCVVSTLIYDILARHQRASPPGSPRWLPPMPRSKESLHGFAGVQHLPVDLRANQANLALSAHDLPVARQSRRPRGPGGTPPSPPFSAWSAAMGATANEHLGADQAEVLIA